MSSAAFISDQYRSEQEALHAKGNYGTASIGYAPLVTEIINRLQATHLLDYGCGRQMNLARHIKPKHKVTYQAYDPGVPDLAGDPVPAHLVCCIDVLEHIEQDRLEFVLDHLGSLTEGAIFVTIHTGPAVKTLSDGRNAHLIQQPLSWWLPKLWERFDLHTVQITGEHGFYVIAYAKSRIEATNGAKL
jgi:hypothetical protein